MGREVRYVSKEWEHLTDSDGDYIPLSDFSYYEDGDNLDYYMPNWDDDEKTHIMMYEDTSEGTPISPKFEKQDVEGLARWLANNNTSAHGVSTASYEQWLGMIKSGGQAPCTIISNEGVMSGVEYIGNKFNNGEIK